MTFIQIIAVILMTHLFAFTAGLLIGQEETNKETKKQRRQRVN